MRVHAHGIIKNHYNNVISLPGCHYHIYIHTHIYIYTHIYTYLDVTPFRKNIYLYIYMYTTYLQCIDNTCVFVTVFWKLS